MTSDHKPDNNGLGLCTKCGRPVHRVDPFKFKAAGYDMATVPQRKPSTSVWPDRANWWWRHNPIPQLKVIPDKERTHCSKCGTPGEWYTFKPGSGECNACTT